VKLDLNTGSYAPEYLAGLHADIQRKYNFRANTDPVPEMDEADAFNFAAIEYLFFYEATRQSRFNRSRMFEAVGDMGGFIPTRDNIPIYINFHGDTVLVSYHAEGDGYVLTINETEFPRDNLNSPDPRFYTAEIGEDYNFVIVTQDRGAEARTFVYYFDGENAHFSGELPVDVFELRVTREGNLVFSRPSTYFVDWPVNEVVVLDSNFRLVPAPMPPGIGYIDFTMTRPVFSREEITVYMLPDVNSPQSVLPAAVTFEIVGTNERDFLRAVQGDQYFFIWVPEEGYIDNGGVRVPARDLLFGLPL
jgi:hypothetical protein